MAGGLRLSCGRAWRYKRRNGGVVFITGHSVYFQCRKRQIEKSKYIRRTRHAAEWFIVPSPVCTGRRSYIERENRPQLQQLGLFFDRSHAQGEVYPFAGGGLKQRPGKPGRTAFHPSPIPPPRVYYRLGKRKREISSRVARKEREKSTRRSLESTMATTP